MLDSSSLRTRSLKMPRVSVVSARSAATAGNFTIESQETPLNQNALSELDSLKKRNVNRSDLTQAKLDDALKKAVTYLKDIVGSINDRDNQVRNRRQNRLEKLQRDGKEESEDAKVEYETFQEKVKGLTARMDESIRQVIDDQKWAENVPASIEHIITTSRDIQNRQRHQEAEDDEDGDTRQITQPDETESASALFNAAQSTAETEWSGQTLTQRYARHHEYIDFYKTRHEAQNQGERAPPLPHSDMWFAAEEGRNTQRSGRATQMQSQSDTQNVDGDSDIEIEGERISCKCPLTLQYFKDPVTSKKCPHSFEKSAIFGLIEISREKLPLSAEQIAELNKNHTRGSREHNAAQAQMTRNQPVYAICPERGCNSMLTINDFRSNFALQRKAQREEEQERALAAYDDSEDSDDAVPRTQRRNVVPITSSPTSGRRRTWVKGEREPSRIPDSQTPAQARGRRHIDVDDVNDEDDGDEEMEEEE